MEPFEQDELTDRELDRLLPRWQAPSPPARLKAAVLEGRRTSLWRRLWTASIRVPVPVVCALGVMLLFVAVFYPRGPRVIVKTERVEVPVYRDRPAVSGAAWQPVRELKLRIIRGSDVQ